MKTRLINRKELVQSYIHNLPKRWYLVIFMNNNKKIADHILKYTDVKLILNRINFIEADSEQSASNFWNQICDLKGIPAYYFSNGSLISYHE